MARKAGSSRLLLLALSVLATYGAPAAAAPAGQDADTVERQREDLRDRLETLRKEIAAAEASRNEAADALRASEVAISNANRKLAELEEEQARLQAELNQVLAERQAVQRDVTARQEQIARLLHRGYLAGGQSPMRALLSGDNPNQSGRDAAYLSYVSNAQARLLTELQTRQEQLAALETTARDKQQGIARLANEQTSQRDALVKQAETHRKVLASIANKLMTQRREIGALERNEVRLSRVIEGITRMVAERARRQKEEEERAIRVAARREKAAAQPTPATDPSNGGRTYQEATSEDGAQSAFARLRGRLRMPVPGEVVGRFGASRGDGGATWKGLFIRARRGADVKSVAAGRVVYSEWLRGFGNLIIVDHGDEFLSVYGNNESLLKEPGDQVRAGETIAHVGASGGNMEPGLYFELRHQGQPFDPLKWAASK